MEQLVCFQSSLNYKVRKTKTKVITLAITKNTDNTVNQSKFEVISCSWRKARENACERVTIAFGFTSDWMKKWRESFKPITKRSNRKTNYFSTIKWKPL